MDGPQGCCTREGGSADSGITEVDVASIPQRLLTNQWMVLKAAGTREGGSADSGITEVDAASVPQRLLTNQWMVLKAAVLETEDLLAQVLQRWT